MIRRGSILDVVLVCTALVSVAWLTIDLRRPSGTELGERREMLLRAFRAEDVRKLVVERPGQPELVVKRAPESAGFRFTLDGATPEPAADEAVDSWLAALRLATPRRRVSLEAAGALAQQLASPAAALSIDLGAVSYRLVRGSALPADPKLVYVGVSGDGVSTDAGVVVLAAGTADQLFPSRESLLPRQLLPAAPSEWHALEFRTKDTTIRLERDAGDAGWHTSRPPARVSRDAFKRIEVALTRLEARPRIELGRARVALGTADATFGVETGAEATAWRFELGGTCPEGPGMVAIRLAPTSSAGCVTQEILAALPVSRASIVDRGLFGVGSDEIERLVIVDGDSQLEIARDESGFRMLAPTVASVPLEPGNELLERLGAIQGDILPAPSTTADTKWVGSVRVVISGAGEGPPREEVLRLGPLERHGERQLLREADGLRLRLNPAEAALVSADATPLLPAAVFSLKPLDIRQVSLSQGSLRLVMARSDTGRFALEEPRGFELDQEATERLFAAAGNLQARRRVSLHELGPADLGTATLKLELTPRAAEVATAGLEIGARGREGYIARRTPGGDLYLLAPTSVDALQSLVLSPSTWNCGPSELLGVRVVLADGSYSIESDGTAFVSTPVPSPQDEALTSALASLAPLGLVHFGAPLAYEGGHKPLLTLERSARASAPAPCGRRMLIGTADAWHEQAIYYAWFDGLDAVFAVPRAPVQTLLGQQE